MDRKELLAGVQSAAREKDRYAAAYRSLDDYTVEMVYPILRAYILDRFMLTPAQCTSDKILDLADVSLRHILELKKQGLYRGDISRSCSGASSVIAKKVLLMKAVQDDFGVTMTPAQSAALETVGQLAAFLVEQRGN